MAALNWMFIEHELVWRLYFVYERTIKIIKNHKKSKATEIMQKKISLFLLLIHWTCLYYWKKIVWSFSKPVAKKHIGQHAWARGCFSFNSITESTALVGGHRLNGRDSNIYTKTCSLFMSFVDVLTEVLLVGRNAFFHPAGYINP